MGSVLWKALALVFILLAMIGAVLPVMPTVPFLLLAAAAASRGWPSLDERLMSHARYGPTLRRWRERGAVPRAAKGWATLGMTGSSVMVWLSPLPLWLRVLVPAVMLVVACWLWARPEE